MFQVSDIKGNNFLDLLDEEYLPIKPMYTKGSVWLKLFSHSNLLYTRAIRVITNYALISEY